jgi:uncharacterized protein
MLNPELLKILVCPEARLPVALADPVCPRRVNDAIGGGEVTHSGGSPVSQALDSALLREDGLVLYPIRDDIPVMLIDESIQLEFLLLSTRGCSRSTLSGCETMRPAFFRLFFPLVLLAVAGCAGEYPQSTIDPRTDFAEIIHNLYVQVFWWTMLILAVVWVGLHHRPHPLPRRGGRPQTQADPGARGA